MHLTAMWKINYYKIDVIKKETISEKFNTRINAAHIEYI